MIRSREETDDALKAELDETLIIWNPMRAAALTENQIEFLLRSDIVISGDYVGMLRAYCHNRVVWQTSCASNIMNVKIMGEAIRPEHLLPQLRTWVTELMGMSEEELQIALKKNINLLST